MPLMGRRSLKNHEPPRGVTDRPRKRALDDGQTQEVSTC
jgi:hypothetical protein